MNYKNVNHYVMYNARIVHVEDGKVTNGSLEIKNGYIERVFLKEINIPDKVHKVDLAGKYVIPGLIDMHCHIKEGFAPAFVASGVTTVRNTAGNIIELKPMIEAPIDAPTPRVYSADRMVDGPPGLWGPTSEGNFVTDDPEAARWEVRRQAEAGAKFIKVYGWIDKKVMEAVVQEARKYNLEVSCDLHHASKVNALDAAEVGVTWFEHASGFAQAMYPGWSVLTNEKEWAIDWENPDEQEIKKLCKKMLTYNVKLCPTMMLHDQFTNPPKFWNSENEIPHFIKEGIGQHWKQMNEQVDLYKDQVGFINNFTQAVAKTYYDLGGTVVAGTDFPAGGVWTYPGMALHRELEIFVEIGLSELAALQAATIRAARAIELHDIGIIKEGAVADLVILSENPLEDIRNTQKIDQVIKGGKYYTTDELERAIPSNEKQMENYERFKEEFEEMIGGSY